jgi:hypothetical protein
MARNRIRTIWLIHPAMIVAVELPGAPKGG